MQQPETQPNQNGSYGVYARFYDQIEAAPDRTVGLITAAINTHAPHTRTVLEVACGTGNVLAAFAIRYEVSGLDLSEGMLAVARQKLPKAKLIIRI